MFSPVVVEHSMNPRNMTPLLEPDVVGMSGVQGEGPYLSLSLRFSEGIVVETSFATYGCPVARACGSFVSEWVKGKTVEQAGVLTANDLMLVLGGLPLGKEHCAVLAVDSLADSLVKLVALNSQDSTGNISLL